VPFRFINPNYHVILIHYPLGVFVLGVILEIISFISSKSSARVAARWMIVLGALLSVPAATSGIAALHDVQKQGAWAVDRYAFMRSHVLWMSIGTLLAVFCAIVGLGASNLWRNRLRIPLLLGCLAALGCMTNGAWYAGESIYTMGTSVMMVKYKGKGEKITPTIPPAMQHRPELQPPPDESSATPDERAQMEHQYKYDRFAKYYIGGEEQVHIVVAGFALAFALGAMGLSFRRLTSLRSYDQMQMESEQQEVSLIGGPPRRVTDDVAMMRTLNPDAAVEPQERVPVSRFWLLSILVTLITVVLGYWILEKDKFATSEGFHAFLRVIAYPKEHHDEMRHFAHFVLGCGLVLVMFLMAILELWMPRRRIALAFFSIVLVFLMVAQVWIGILLTFDDEGPLMHFNKADADSAMIDHVAAPVAQI